MTLSIVAAIARDGAIGKDGHMPWPILMVDLRWFIHITTAKHPEKMASHFIRYPYSVDIAQGTKSQSLSHLADNACIMGWRTYQSIGKTLKQRTSIVLRDTTYHGADEWPCKVRTFNEALEHAARLHVSNVFAIGGARVFAETLLHPDCTQLFLTEVDAEYPDADTWFPWMRMNWNDGILYTYDHGHKMQHWFQRLHVSSWIEGETGPKYRLTIWKRYQ